MSVKEKALTKPGSQLQQLLNEQLANWAVMYVKLHHYHWYINGLHFQTLHAKFEELYNMAALMLDELAERMLAIGLLPASTMKEYLALATIDEDKTDNENDHEMLGTVAQDFEKMAEALKKAAEIADEGKDGATADILYGQVEALQKQIWILKATIGK